jgi:hypothetical protein
MEQLHRSAAKVHQFGHYSKRWCRKNETGQKYLYVWSENYQSTLSNCSLNPFGYDDSQSLRRAQIEWLCHPEAILYLKIPY